LLRQTSLLTGEGKRSPLERVESEDLASVSDSSLSGDLDVCSEREVINDTSWHRPVKMTNVLKVDERAQQNRRLTTLKSYQTELFNDTQKAEPRTVQRHRPFAPTLSKLLAPR